MMLQLNKIKWKLEKFLMHRPYFYFLTKKMLKHVPVLLPHDRDYYALKHLGLNENKLFLDVGANDGISARSFRRFNSDFDIVSVEPNPYHKESLENLKRTDSKFDYIMTGAGHKDTMVELFMPVYENRIPLHSAASTDRESLKKNIDSVYDDISDRIELKKIKINITPLDTFNFEPSIIKVDTEGQDPNVLRGLRNTIERHKPSIMVEAQGKTKEEIIKLFDEFDYQPLYYIHEQNKFSTEIPENVKNLFGVSNQFIPKMNDLIIDN